MTTTITAPAPGVDAPAPATKRILFVDDDEFLLEGLRDALRPYRRQWTMSFVTSGQAALNVLAAGPYQVMVCDLRMPGMDGATLLELARDLYPATVRIVLSGHADIKMVSRAAAAAHRLVAKPCETEELAAIIQRSCALQDIATRVELDPRAIGASALPSVPHAYAQLSELLRSGSAGASDIAQVINQDIAMAAKAVALANSAYFGRRRPTASITEAVAYLGVDTLRALLLHTEAFRAFRVDPPIPGFDLDELERHCTRVARLANAILTDTGGSGDAFTAGLLHDIGLLVLAAQAPDHLGQLLTSAHQQHRPVAEVERDQRGATHAEIGAHLLALWGLPHTVTEAVAGHHDPAWLKLPFDTVAAVHVAEILVETVEAADHRGAPATRLPDHDYLTEPTVTDRLDHWHQLAQDLVSDAADTNA